MDAQDVGIPVELAEALGDNAEAKARFDSLPPSHQREYINWITEAKRTETRERRAAKAVLMLLTRPER